ncbi:zinc-ribbon domain-containing protein, partial [Flavobacteriaceae bacterium]|nr:zinc-ribbon domain-containing protein [Flavobacteriaceae bacterium]
CLETVNPKLAKQWHPTKNGSLTPLDVSIGSFKNIWWKCDKGDDHEWKAYLSTRSRSGCPFCTLTPQSKQELTITFELMKLFKNIDPKGFKTKLDGRLRAIDIFIPKLNLCIEFDGSYWHKDKRDLDKIKSEMLFDEGFKLIRVREEPLKKIYDADIISERPYDGKKITNDILSKIINIFNLDNKLVSKIKDYQSKEGLQNEKGLDIYIDQILTEKANKK